MIIYDGQDVIGGVASIESNRCTQEFGGALKLMYASGVDVTKIAPYSKNWY